MKTAERKKLTGRLQDLIGRARGAYLNDRSASRADDVLSALDEAFEVVVRLNSSYAERRR